MTSALLRPFFPYYGSKWRTAPSYPPPAHDLIVEPCAGSAGYATRHHGRSVLLIDRDPVVARVWDYLIRVKASELLRVPDVQERIDELGTWPEELRFLVGFWLNRGGTRPYTARAGLGRMGMYPDQYWGEAVRRRLAWQVDQIRHWRVMHAEHTDAPHVRATWFVDFPYQGACGRRYRMGHQGLDFPAIADWCKRRHGLVVVCEQAGADWLPFTSFKRVRTANAATRSHEVVWIRRERAEQLHLFAPGAQEAA